MISCPGAIKNRKSVSADCLSSLSLSPSLASSSFSGQAVSGSNLDQECAWMGDSGSVLISDAFGL